MRDTNNIPCIVIIIKEIANLRTISILYTIVNRLRYKKYIIDKNNN